MITYRKGDLFQNAPLGAILAHACNCRGIWGAGIARQFADLYPEVYAEYATECEKLGSGLLGACAIYKQDSDKIACLFTSDGFGNAVDPERSILDATQTALEDLLRQVGSDVEIHMPKINSGLFEVPWEKTEAVLKKLDGNFIVWYL